MRYPSLMHEYFESAAARNPAKEALVCRDRRWTYQALRQQSDSLAGALTGLGVRKQDRVAVFMDNEAEVVISMIGIMKAGAIFVNLNGMLKPKKLSYILRDSGASALITSVRKSAPVSEALADADGPRVLFWKGPSASVPAGLAPISHLWEDVCSGHSPALGGRRHEAEDNGEGIIDQDLAALIYTSGSTGEPKGVMSSHHNMVSAAKSITRYLQNRESDIILNVLPLSFDYGLYQVLMSFLFGGTVVLEESFMFIHSTLKRVEEERVTGFPLVPTVLAMMLGRQDLKKYDFSSLRYVTNTGAALPVEHIRRFRSLFPDVRLYSMFGLTECKRVCYLPPEEVDRRPASVGKAMPNCEVWIEDDSGREVGHGEIGELVIRGSNVMRGYWNAPELSAKVFRPGRYPGELVLRSGDYFRKDEEGYLYFHGRKDDMIKCRGERVSAKEVENILHEIQGVREAAVAGIPDGIEGQSIKAFVVVNPAAGLGEKHIRKYCADHLEPFAVPRHIQFVDELPKTTNGKIDKKRLVET